MNVDLRRFASYEDALAGFKLELPEQFNVAEVLGYHSTPDRPALHCAGGRARLETMTFGALQEASARLGSAFRRLGVRRGSRVALALTSTPEAAIVELGAMRVGAVAASLRPGARDEAWRDQLTLVVPEVIVCEPEAVAELRALAPAGCQLVSVARGEWASWWTAGVVTGAGTTPSLAELLAEGDANDPVDCTAAADPAYITFTSGSTGAMKAVVLPHGSFLAGVPAFQMFTNLAPHPGDVFFPSLGWANSGGLRTMTFPAWYFGFPVVGVDHMLADGRAVAELLTGMRVSVALLMPQILRELRALGEDVLDYDWTALRVIATTGEPISSDLRDWLESVLGVVINPYYGASEISYVASTCRAWFPSAHGEVGRRVPGRELTVVGEDSLLAAEPGAAGMLAVRRSDLGLSLGYRYPGQEEPRFDASSATDEFFLTGDLGIVSGTGNVRYLGRSGQSIRSCDGDAIPPMDVEDAVQSVAAVREAAVVQSQDDPPGVVCACVSLVDPRADETSFANEIGAAVSLRFNESLRVTRVVVFDELPKTAGTAKINRRRAAEILQTGTPVPAATIVLSDSIPKPV